VFQPVHGFAVEGFGDGDVGEGGGGSGAVPVFFAWREPDDVAGVDGFHGAAGALNAAGTGGDDEGLAEGMGMPGGAGAGFKGDNGTADAGGIAAFEGRVNANDAGEPVGRAFGGGLGAVAFDFHGYILGLVEAIIQLFWTGKESIFHVRQARPYPTCRSHFSEDEARERDIGIW